MAKHAHTTPPSRRRLFGGALGLVCAPAVASALPVGDVPGAAHPDAELLAACAEFVRLERLWLATDWKAEFDSPEEAAAEVEQTRLRREQKPWLNRICSLRASTLEGVAAIGACCTAFDAGAEDWSDAAAGPYTNTRLEAALMRSLASAEVGA